ncbi:MAG: hypothetical protein ABL912_01845 [Novosphingobium sp.]
MAIRDELNTLVDGLRRDIVDEAFGLRLDTVVVRRRAWSGGQVGKGVATDSDLVLDPVPRVSRPAPELGPSEPGKREAGDVTVDRISAFYTESQLAGNSPASAELIWLINNEPYRVVGIEQTYLQWVVHLSRMRNR